MSFFKLNRKVIFLFFLFFNVFLILNIFLATQHAILERDIKRIKKNYFTLNQENQNIKIKEKVDSEEKILAGKLNQHFTKKNIKQIPIIKFF